MDQAPDLATVLAVVPTKFQERWCGGPIAWELAKGEVDTILVYNPFEAAGEAMAASVKADAAGASAQQEEPSSVTEFNVVPLVASAFQIRAALLVKLFANLFCYNPDVCAGACSVLKCPCTVGTLILHLQSLKGCTTSLYWVLVGYSVCRDLCE